MIITELKNKTKQIAVIGLGYVGLPLALELAKKYKVIGFDINNDRLDKMRKGIDPSRELDSAAFIGRDISYTSNIEDLKRAHFYIATVPTPIDEHNNPDLKAVILASKMIGQVISKGDFVVYESTVYPGCTEEECLPVIEEGSGLKSGVDFSYGYSPERINPGDKERTIDKIVKVVSGNNQIVTDQIAAVYESIIKAGIHKATSIRVAEAAKVIENAQRDINIAFVNELSIIFDKMGIRTSDVLKAASTKWNFLPFYPGLVGGHCIGVDPYYLTYKAAQIGYDSKVILSGRAVNDDMPFYVARRLIQKLKIHGKDPGQAHVLVLGVTFKENVADIRNSKVIPMIQALMDQGVSIDVADPFADADELSKNYNISLSKGINAPYDALILAVNHSEYGNKPVEEMMKYLVPGGIFMDLKGIYEPVDSVDYWSL
jgi:UDP-N-acetyl-D-galactosamine dehydrogenase